MRQAIPTFAAGARLRLRSILLPASIGLLMLTQGQVARGQNASPPPAAEKPPATSQWKTSPYHGVIGGDGTVIPCRCLFRGTAYRLGAKVCMTTHLGTVMTECDMQQNNTSWVPTDEACTIS
jgi:hypothetical protein